MLRMRKRDNGIVLVTAMIVVLLVSLVAYAIGSTAVANRHLSNSVYDQSSSFANAQAGLNIGEQIVIDEADDAAIKGKITEFNPGGNESSLAQMLSGTCANALTLSNAANDCFWWLGNVLSGPYSNPKFLSYMGSDFYDYSHAGTYFKLEKRPEDRDMPDNMDAKLTKAFYRVTSIGTGNGAGLVKLQGQIATIVQKNTEIEVDEPCESDDC